MTTFLKVQLLFVMILFGVVIYTYFLYNDVIRLEREVVNLKSAVTRLEVGNTIKELVADPDTSCPLPSAAPQASNPFELTPIPEDDDNIEDDNDSVTSNEIKQLLTNINEDIPAPAVPEPPQADAPTEPPPATATVPPTPLTDLADLSEQDLLTYKYEDLRAYLKAKGIACKNGPKIDLVRRILSKATA